MSHHFLASSVLNLFLLSGVLLPAQAQWTQVPASSSGRLAVGMGYDDTHGILLVVVGAKIEILGYDGVAWTALPNAGAPPWSSNGFSACYDTFRRRMVLVSPPQTWEWDGTSWTEIATTTAPSPRADASIAYDSVRREVLLFGGDIWDSSTASTSYMSDLWAWDGATWTQKVATGPAGRSKAAMAFDHHRGVAVLHGGWWTYRVPSFYPGGGYGTSAVHLNDTWEWDGTSWSNPASGVGFKGHAMAYEPQRRRVIMFGGSTNTRSWDWTGEYDRTGWVRLRQGGGPPARSDYIAMAFDRGRGRMMMAGGYSSPDAWEYFTPRPASATAFGTGCAGTVGTPSLVANELPWLGGTLSVQVDSVPTGEAAVLALGASTSAWGTVALPGALAAAGMPGCTLDVSIDSLLPMTGSGHSAAFSVPIPNAPSAAGAALHLQSFITDRGANPLGAISSNAVSGTFGVW